MASASKKPSDDNLPSLLKPMSEGINAIGQVKSGKAPDLRNHLQTVAEGAPAVGWVTAVCSRYFALDLMLLKVGLVA
jgi:hypothetical protein